MLSERYAYLLVFNAKWWVRMCDRNRESDRVKVFVRRNRVGPLKAKKLLFYVGKPIMQISGVADFVERLVGDYKKLWDAWGDETCLIDFNEYVDFLDGRETATFIRFTNFREFEDPLPFETVMKTAGIPRIPRGGKYLNRKTANLLTV